MTRMKPQNTPLVKLGKKLRPRVDAGIARYSEWPNTPLLDPADLPWTEPLRGHWQAIAAEALAVTSVPESVPSLASISPDHRGIAPEGQWRSFFLKGYGNPVVENLARCPVTARVIAGIPRLNSAFFSVLAPGTHIPAHRGVTKGLVTCHLGLKVPPGPCRMRVGEEIVHWEEGAILVFDDTYNHEVWNDTAGTRIVLLLQVERPVRFPGNLLQAAFLGGVRRSSFVRAGVKNLRDFNARVTGLEDALND